MKIENLEQANILAKIRVELIDSINKLESINLEKTSFKIHSIVNESQFTKFSSTAVEEYCNSISRKLSEEVVKLTILSLSEALTKIDAEIAEL